VAQAVLALTSILKMMAASILKLEGVLGNSVSILASGPEYPLMAPV
jgi:hypothetical protein